MGKRKMNVVPVVAAEPRELTLDEKAVLTAYQLRSAKKSLAEYLKDMNDRLVNAPAEFERELRYAQSEGDRARYAVDFANKLTSNMRLDLVVKYGAEIEKYEAMLEIMRPLVTDEIAKAKIASIIGEAE